MASFSPFNLCYKFKSSYVVIIQTATTLKCGQRPGICCVSLVVLLFDVGCLPFYVISRGHNVKNVHVKYHPFRRQQQQY